MKETVNLIIFRLPDDGGDKMFVELPYLDGKLHKQGTRFMVNNPEDNYLTMEFYHLVLAKTTQEGSLDLCRLAIKNEEHNTPVHALPFDALDTLVKESINVYSNSAL